MTDAPAPMLDVRNLEMHFSLGGSVLDRLRFGKKGPRIDKPVVRAVNGVNFTIERGEIMALVGESGCGKSTVAKTIARIYKPTGGALRIDGEDVAEHDFAQMLPVRAKMQMIFQDPYASLNPRQKVRDIVAEPLLQQTKTAAERREVPKKIEALLAKVGLNAEHAGRYPHQFSGGQRQRIGIARALSVTPGLIVADEPVSALDVSIQAQIVNLLGELQEELGLSYLFIAHDLKVVELVSRRVAVMYLGKIAELTTSEALYRDPKHPYTRALLSAVPVPDPTRDRKRIVLEGDVPSPLNPPSGCRFHPRCPIAKKGLCDREEPELRELAPGHVVACHLAE